jgi:hypothetical protein
MLSMQTQAIAGRGGIEESIFEGGQQGGVVACQHTARLAIGRLHTQRRRDCRP